METIEELSKCEEMSIPPPDNLRICLVGCVADDISVLEASKTFGVPVIMSVSGEEYISDLNWTTYFIMKNFDGPIYNQIIKTKHRLMGPPALQQAVQRKEGLTLNNRPVYNYSMRGVITCFTGIRRKDELTRLVHLIHSMGGSIRKDLNTKVTHLICNTSGGEKYKYAMTFRLSVVRSNWVYDAWGKRDDIEFQAVNDDFTKEHRLKAFEGLKICFFGFASDEHQHMVDVLIKNGGAPANLEDPDCSHVIMANTGGHFPDNIPLFRYPSPNLSPIKHDEDNEKKQIVTENIELITEESDIASTPPKSNDGIILNKNDENVTNELMNISPIEKFTENDISFCVSNHNKYLKRKRDSFDNLSILSNDSCVDQTYSSAKKPKLTRTGSISRTLKRSMSFVVNRTPILHILRPRRNSVDPNSSFSSVVSFDATLNETIRKPVKDKLRGMRERLTRSCKRDFNSITPNKRRSNSFKIKDTILMENDILKSSKTTTTTTIEPEKSIDSIDFKTTNESLAIIPETNHSSGISMNLICSNTKNLNPKEMPPVKISFATDTSSAKFGNHNTKFKAINPTAIMDFVSITNDCNISFCPAGETSTVVDEHTTQVKPEPKNSRTPIVRSDWFWYTIQNGYADETDYLFGDYLENIANTPVQDRRESLPISFNKRKRKRFSQRLQSDGTPIGAGKRRSSVSDAGLLSVSGSFLDCTASPEKHESGKVLNETEPIFESTPKNKSMRYNHFMDLYNTESNYVGILDTILNLFKIPLEEKAESGDALLNKSEVRAIFSNFLPIHDVHCQMLAKFRELQAKWQEDCLIGQIILQHKEDLIKAYPPYVNFFEHMKETLVQCDTQNPRFHAFLKINQAKPECGRQTLQDLMIRPVQRLPSISLLLNDILKHTNKINPDNKKLEEALKAIKDVMAHINEDKRKTEGQLAIFDIFNDIEGCPAHLVSSHRSYISKCEVTEISSDLSGRGDSLVLYLFTDTIEVCKKRSRGFNSAKSPSNTKSYKHIKLMPLSSIKFVIDICDSPRAFAITFRNNQDSKEKLFSFIIDEETDKVIYIRSLCKQIAENACRTDTEKSLLSMTAQELNVDLGDINLSTLSKAFKFAARTRLKVGRAFSFNKTPSKLKRAISTTITSPFGSTNSLTPASQLAQMKLASCTNINEVGNDDNCCRESSSSQPVLVAPMSVQPTRKAKCSSLTLANLRKYQNPDNIENKSHFF